MKKQNKYIFRIVLLVIVLAGAMAGLILWTNWTVNSNTVTVLKTSEMIEFGDTQLSQKVVAAKVNKDAVEGVNYVSQDKINFYKAKYTIPKGVILTYDYLIGVDEDIGPTDVIQEDEKYVYFPITVNAANTSYGYLQVGQSYQMYGIKTVEDANDKTSIKMYGKVASNVKMVEILSGSFQGGGSASCTFQIEKEQLNTVVSYVNGGATLYFLDGNINEGSDSETFINNVLASTVYSPEKNSFTLMPEGEQLWKPWTEENPEINVVIAKNDPIDLGNGKIQAVKRGFNFRWRDFLPTSVSVRYYDRTGSEGTYFANYFMNGSSTIAPDGKEIKDADEYFTHKFTYDSQKGIYTLGEWFQNSSVPQRLNTFSDEGYYEITLTREYSKTEKDDEGKETTTSEKIVLNYYFFVVENTSSTSGLNYITYYKENNNAIQSKLQASYKTYREKVGEEWVQYGSIDNSHSGIAAIEGASNMTTTMKANYSNALNYQIAESYVKVHTNSGIDVAVPYYWNSLVSANEIYAETSYTQIKNVVSALRDLISLHTENFSIHYSETYRDLNTLYDYLNDANFPNAQKYEQLSLNARAFLTNLKHYQRDVVSNYMLPTLENGLGQQGAALAYYQQMYTNLTEYFTREETSAYIVMLYNSIVNSLSGTHGIFGAIDWQLATQLGDRWTLGGETNREARTFIIVNHYEKPAELKENLAGKYGFDGDFSNPLNKFFALERENEPEVFVNDSILAD